MLFNIFTTLSELFAAKLKRGVFTGEKINGTRFPADAGRRLEPLVLTAFSEDADSGKGGGAEEFETLIKGEYRDAFSKKCQSLIDRRFKETKELEGFRAEALPIIDLLSEKLNLKKGDFALIKETLENYDFGSLQDGLSEKTANAASAASAANAANAANGENGISSESAENSSNLPLVENNESNESLPFAENGEGGDFRSDVERWNTVEGDVAGSSGEMSVTCGGKAENADGESGKKAALRDYLLAKRYAAADGLYREMLNEAAEVSKLYPTFDLESECRTPAFCALVATGKSLRDSYEALHKDEIIGEAIEYTARAVSEALSRNVQYRGRRITENALSAVSSPLAKRSVSEMSDGEIMEIVKKVGRGEKVVF